MTKMVGATGGVGALEVGALEVGTIEEGTVGRLCRWCQRPFPIRSGRGRPRRYCRPSCRQQAFMARKLADAHGLADDEVIVARAGVEAVQDRLALLGQALADIERDRQHGGDAVDALEWLLEHARDAAALRLEPRWRSGSVGSPPGDDELG